jgi:negative regulator of flagellin synthesis FlgM
MGDIMKITNYDQNPYVAGANRTQGVGAAQGKPTSEKADIQPKDKVSLSETSRVIQLAEDAVAAAPDVRPEMVNPIKQQIAEGTYKINAETLAEGIIGTFISERA